MTLRRRPQGPRPPALITRSHNGTTRRTSIRRRGGFRASAVATSDGGFTASAVSQGGSGGVPVATAHVYVATRLEEFGAAGAHRECGGKGVCHPNIGARPELRTRRGVVRHVTHATYPCRSSRYEYR